MSNQKETSRGVCSCMTETYQKWWATVVSDESEGLQMDGVLGDVHDWRKNIAGFVEFVLLFVFKNGKSCN